MLQNMVNNEQILTGRHNCTYLKDRLRFTVRLLSALLEQPEQVCVRVHPASNFVRQSSPAQIVASLGILAMQARSVSSAAPAAMSAPVIASDPGVTIAGSGSAACMAVASRKPADNMAKIEK